MSCRRYPWFGTGCPIPPQDFPWIRMVNGRFRVGTRSPMEPLRPFHQPPPSPDPPCPATFSRTRRRAARDQPFRHVHEPRQGALDLIQVFVMERSLFPRPAVGHQVHVDRPRRIAPEVLGGPDLVFRPRAGVGPDQFNLVHSHVPTQPLRSKKMVRLIYTRRFWGAKDFLSLPVPRLG